MTPLSGWENFYVILGSSAGALIGLQFVVMTLIADMPTHPDIERAGNAFATPTIVHFGAVLLLSALVSAPWGAIAPAAASWGTMGAAGVVYTLIVLRRMRQQEAYRPVFEDWMFHAVLPLVAYVALLASGYMARPQPRDALFTVAGAGLLLLFIGIHNAWDAVTYHVLVKRPKQKDKT